MPKLPTSLLLAGFLLTALPSPWAISSLAAAPDKKTPGVAESGLGAYDLNPEGEAGYKRSLLKWLDNLPQGQREKARKILNEAQADVQALRARIRQKKAELEALRLDSSTPPDTMPRIGVEIRSLRSQLRQRLLRVTELLRSEAGIPLDTPSPEGFWLNLPPEQPSS